MTESEAPSQIPIGYTSLQGDPIQLTPLQQLLEPRLATLQVIWWGIWVCTLAFLLVRFCILPFLKK